MDANLNQLEQLQRLLGERVEDNRLLQAIGQQVQANQRFFDVELTQIQQSLRQMGFKIIAIKKHDKPRQEEENRILDALGRISSLNLPERMFIYKFCQNVIKLFRPDMQIIRFNQKDTRDLLLMFKQFFMAENNFEAIHLVQSLFEQEFKMNIALILIRQLIQKSRDEFQHQIQQASETVIQRIKHKIAEQSKAHQHTEQAQPQAQPPAESPKYPRKRNLLRLKRDLSVTQTKVVPIFRSVSLVQQPSPTPNPERELKLQLRLQQKQLRKKFVQISKPILDLDTDHYWCLHIVLKKKFYKHPDRYFLQNGSGFYIWCQLKNWNQNIRVTITNYYFHRTHTLIGDKIEKDAISDIHKAYNLTCQSPRKPLPALGNSPLIAQSPLKRSFHPILPSIQRVPLRSTMFYDPLREQAQQSFKSLNLSQEHIQEYLSKRRHQSKDEQQLI